MLGSLGCVDGLLWIGLFAIITWLLPVGVAGDDDSVTIGDGGGGDDDAWSTLGVPGVAQLPLPPTTPVVLLVLVLVLVGVETGELLLTFARTRTWNLRVGSEGLLSLID